MIIVVFLPLLFLSSIGSIQVAEAKKRGGGIFSLIGKGISSLSNVGAKSGKNIGAVAKGAKSAKNAKNGSGMGILPGLAIGLVYDPNGESLWQKIGLYLGGNLPIPVFGGGGIYGTSGIILGGSQGFTFAMGGGLFFSMIGLGMLVPVPAWLGILGILALVVLYMVIIRSLGKKN